MTKPLSRLSAAWSQPGGDIKKMKIIQYDQVNMERLRYAGSIQIEKLFRAEHEPYGKPYGFPYGSGTLSPANALTLFYPLPSNRPLPHKRTITEKQTQ